MKNLDAIEATRRFAQSLAGADADDLLQEAALAMLEHPPERTETLPAWLRKVVLNRWRMTMRSAARRHRRELAATSTEPVWQEPLDQRRSAVRLRIAIAALPEPYRSTIIAHYFEGKTSLEIAAAEGIPAVTVRTRIFRGLAKLRRESRRR